MLGAPQGVDILAYPATIGGWHEWGTHRREPERGREPDSLMCTVCGKSFSGAKVLATHCKVVHKLAGVPGGGRSGGGAWDATPAKTKTGAASVDTAGWRAHAPGRLHQPDVLHP